MIKKKEMYVAREDFSVEKKTTETQMLKDNMKWSQSPNPGALRKGLVSRQCERTPEDWVISLLVILER